MALPFRVVLVFAINIAFFTNLIMEPRLLTLNRLYNPDVTYCYDLVEQEAKARAKGKSTSKTLL